MLYIVANTQYELTQKILSEINVYETRIIDGLNYFRYKSKFLKKICTMLFMLNFSLPYRFIFSNTFIAKIQNINADDSILFWDICLFDLINEICSVVKSKNIKVFFWNTIGKSKSLKGKLWFKQIKKLKKKIEFLTFDSADATNYGFKITNQICYDPNKYFVETGHLKDSDVYFVGKDKGRYEIVNSIYEELISFGFVCDFNVVRDKTSPIKVNHAWGLFELTFEDNIAHINKTKALLEIVKEKQIGLTMRTLESLFFKKKLITNNRDIENYDFYSPKNIFILGKDEHIEVFLKSDFDDTIKFNKADYLIDTWLEKNLMNINACYLINGLNKSKGQG